MTREILIWGEFPPRTSTGISISNQMVLKFLKARGQYPRVLEEYSWNKKHLDKLAHVLGLNFSLLKCIIHKRPDIFYFSFPLSVFGELKFLLPLLSLKIFSGRSRVIAHLHRGDLQVFIQKGFLQRALTRCSLSLVSEVIVLSPDYVEQVHELLPAKQVQVMRNTSAIETHPHKTVYAYNRRFICISNYIRAKGIQTLFDCFSKTTLNDYTIDIFGEAHEKAFFKKLDDYKLLNITTHGPISREDLPGYLAGYDCLVMPSWNEGQPLIILEAMSLGVPVIASAVGDIPFILGNEYPFLTIPRDPESLEQAILDFDRLSDKRGLAIGLQRRYMLYFSNNKFEEKLSEIFKM